MQETQCYKFLLVWEAVGVCFFLEGLYEYSEKWEGFFFKKKERDGGS